MKKNIIKYSRPFNSYNVTRCFSVYVKDSKNLKNTIPFYKYNFSRDILNSDPKIIIKFISTSYQKPKVILDLCTARNQKLNDRQMFDNVDANADKKKNINKKYLNILWLFGIVLSLGAPTLIDTMIGVNIYDQYYITESIYSKSVINIRITCATVFLYSIICLWLSNVDRLKQAIFNKPILWAPIIVGLDKFKNPELNAEHVTTKHTYMLNKNKWAELNENEISASSKV